MMFLDFLERIKIHDDKMKNLRGTMSAIFMGRTHAEWLAIIAERDRLKMELALKITEHDNLKMQYSDLRMQYALVKEYSNSEGYLKYLKEGKEAIDLAASKKAFAHSTRNEMIKKITAHNCSNNNSTYNDVIEAQKIIGALEALGILKIEQPSELEYKIDFIYGRKELKPVEYTLKRFPNGMGELKCEFSSCTGDYKALKEILLDKGTKFTEI